VTLSNVVVFFQVTLPNVVVLMVSIASQVIVGFLPAQARLLPGDAVNTCGIGDDNGIPGHD